MQRSVGDVISLTDLCMFCVVNHIHDTIIKLIYFLIQVNIVYPRLVR